MIVIIDSNILGGTPVIDGTRIPVSTVVYLNRKLKKSPATIATKYYTQLSVDQIIEAIKWFDTNGDKYVRVDI